MLFGWTGVLVLLLVIAILGKRLSADHWLSMLLCVQAFAMFSDVPADGYSVELGKLEDETNRGKILTTGQEVRFAFCILAGIIQTFFLNSTQTSYDGCPVSSTNDPGSCWTWGLSVNGYYALVFCVVFVLVIPIIWLKELDASNIPIRTFREHILDIWETLQSRTTLSLMCYSAGMAILTNFPSTVNYYFQYYVLQLNNFQAGIDTISTYCTLTIAIGLFKRYFTSGMEIREDFEYFVLL